MSFTTAELNRGLTEEGRRLLNRLSAFCANWEGKLIDYKTEGRFPDHRKGYVRGHDGPYWNRHADAWVIPSVLEGSLGFGSGWGCVMIANRVGSTHHVDAALIVEVKEVTRLQPTHTAYEAEAVDMFCIYGCDAHGLRDWDVDWDGPEYEVFCPIHARAAYSEAHDLYHREDSCDGSRPDLEERYWKLVKVAYERALVHA